MDPDDRKRPWDAVVVGAGPAGAATALRLARRGLSVALLERSDFSRPRIGESLAPGVWQRLQALDSCAAFEALAPAPSWGVRSQWSGEPVQQHSYMGLVHACGWHVDRAAFDRMLAEQAAAAGACLRLRTRALRVHATASGWSLDVETTEGAAPHARASRRYAVRARCWIDATGRSARLARQVGARCMAFDRLVGIAARCVVDGGRRMPQHLAIEATEAGWWYFAPLPDGASTPPALQAVLMTDADLCSAAGLHRRPAWQEALQASIRGSTGGTGSDIGWDAPRVHCAATQRAWRHPDSWAQPWLAVGEAGLAVDPLSGSGVLRALDSAERAEATIVALLEGNRRAAIADFEQSRDAECESMLRQRSAHYRDVDRWHGAPFWQRRQRCAA